MADSLLHLQTPGPWRFLLLVLAFVVRAAIALCGDFVLHPDEIMQYLEPAHRLVFGNGVTYWEFFYGARAWLVPGVVAGILNALPSQGQMYRAYSKETGKVGFIRGQDPIFAAYRYLARTSGVLGVWQVDRFYYNLPGYYYLHREIPFYDAYSGRAINKGLEITAASVSHIVSADTNLVIPGYTVEKNFGDIQIWRRDENDAPIRRWEVYNPIIGGVEQIMAQVNPNAPTPPPNRGIRFTAENR